MSFIYIVPIETVDTAWLKPLETAVERMFGLRTRRASGSSIDLDAAYDAGRRQYSSSGILLQLISNPPRDASRILGVAGVDLFIPILTYVFGEAQLDGLGAVVSLHRLNPKFYGLPENSALLTERLVKEAVHELGHTYGLIHCSSPACALSASTYVEDIDQKSSGLCAGCRQQIRPAAG
ncbi:archaemetzincin family Zn-dependent metalloprotease [Thermodesulfobacteriota bacterium]